MSSGVRIASTPSQEDREFVTTHTGENEPSEPRFPEPVVAPAPSTYPQEIDENDEVAERFRLDKFLSAKDRAEDPDTDTVYVDSLGTTVVIRELTDREAEDAYGMFQDMLGAGSMNRAERRKRGVKDKGLVRTSAQVVSIGLVSPDIKNPLIFQKFMQKYGEDLTVTDLLLKIIKPGDILKLSDRILELTGGGDDPIEEAKN